jgi:predicted aminopeptidase
MLMMVAGTIGLGTLCLFFLIVSHNIKRKENGVQLADLVAPLLILAIGGCATAGVAVGYPKYLIWQQEQEGAAELAKAEQNRQIAIQEAKAKEESAKSLANAEVIRAEGVAKANKIIGDSLQNNDAYIHYLWIEALKESHDQVIYVPTEAGIPVTESARFMKDNQKQ